MGAIRRRESEHQEVDTEGSWAISYGDMITLLLTFFILFFSTDHQKDRLQAMDASLMAVFDSQSKLPPKPIEHAGEDPMMEEVVQQAVDAKIFKVGQKLIVQFPSTSFFGLGSVTVTPKGQEELRKFVALYTPYSGNYILGVRAYTDNTPVRQIRGRKYSDNLELSALRAVAAMRVLQNRGIPLNRMKLGGYGELRTTADELSRAVASAQGSVGSALALARKVILVIEPEPKEGL